MKEYIEAIRGRYRKADRREKGRMLEEVTRVTGYHRKSAIRLLRAAEGKQGSKRHGRPRGYGTEVVHALKVVWEVADRVCSKRLAPFVSELVSESGASPLWTPLFQQPATSPLCQPWLRPRPAEMWPR